MRELFSPIFERSRAVMSLGTAVRQRFQLVHVFTLCAAVLLPALYSVPSIAAHTDAAHTASYAVESPAAQTSLLLDIARAGQRLVAVGDRGHILYSDNEGQSWLQARVPTQQLLTAVFFVDEQSGWAVGHDALILHTSDAGQTWTRQYDDLDQEAPLLDVWFKDHNTGYAVGAYGMLLVTHNGGQTWQSIGDMLENEDGYHLNAIEGVSADGIFIVGEMGGMFRSRDAGASWETVDSPYSGSLFGVIAGQHSQELVVYGLRGHIFRSIDFGESWQATVVNTDNGPLKFGLAGGTQLDNGDIVIVGHGGTVLRSDDAGLSFSVKNRADRASLAAVVGSEQQELILVGQNGVQRSDKQGNDVAR